VDNFNITISSYGFLINFYSLYDKLEPQLRTHKNGFVSSFYALLFTAFVYISFAYLSVQCFGEGNIEQNILKNFRITSSTPKEEAVLALIVKVLFLIVFLCTIPFNFFPLKICLLNLIEELRCQRISKSLSKELKDAQVSKESQDRENALSQCYGITIG